MRMLGYATMVIVAGPLLAWAVFVLPGGLLGYQTVLLPVDRRGQRARAPRQIAGSP